MSMNVNIRRNEIKEKAFNKPGHLTEGDLQDAQVIANKTTGTKDISLYRQVKRELEGRENETDNAKGESDNEVQ
ncbi:hypothetical protein ABID56_001758 [Alkalibacillus flavidus]|uniref:Uncharacterized protein n=1 Tax=Alkalibacillus flavidus TaxID=546021 RepID=A0ABV2KWB2_9BACI